MQHDLSKDHIVYGMSKENPPALRVHAGDRVIVETYDCFENQIQSELQDFGTIEWERINPATGPIYVEGAEPGDILLVHIEKIELADHGVMTTGPNLGVLGHTLEENAVRVIPIEQNHAYFSDALHIPVNPMIGVIGTAPSEGTISCGTPGAHGGNMDCKRVTTGARLFLPVNVNGALLALGDLHAAMGDGEIGVSGIEIPGKVTVKLDLLKGRKLPLPMLVTDDLVMTIASHQQLDDAATIAVIDMVNFLHDESGTDKAELTMLLSAIGNLRVCQVVDPLKTARYEVPRWVIEKLGLSLPM